jgi:hypothetical protein
MITPAVRWLAGAYAALSLLTVALIITFSLVAPRLVNPEAWVRGIIVAGTSLLTLMFADRAAKGRPRALLRLRIIVPIILVAIVGVLLFVHLPAWMLVEQAACGVLLLITAALIFARGGARPVA